MIVVEYNRATATMLYAAGCDSWVVRSRHIERKLESATVEQALEEFDAVVRQRAALMEAAAA